MGVWGLGGKDLRWVQGRSPGRGFGTAPPILNLNRALMRVWADIPLSMDTSVYST